jgi:hypothetical protein
MKTWRWIEMGLAGVCVIWLLMAAEGCSQQEYYKPKGWKWKVAPGEVASWKQGILPDGNMASLFEVFARGVTRRPVGAQKIRTFRVGMNVENNTGQALELDSQEAYIMDRSGEVLRCGAMRVSGAQKPFARLRPNAHALLDLYFDLGAETRDLKQFTVHWRYNVGGKAYSQKSVFERDFHGWTE